MEPSTIAHPPGDAALDALFRPRSVAIVGASADSRKWGNWIAAQALHGSVPVHLVNRTGVRVLDRPTHRTATAIGEPVDLAVISVPVTGFEDAVQDALAAGARAIVGITAGFGERGAEGLALQHRIVAAVRAAGARLLGPNCLGLLDQHHGLLLAPNRFPTGSVALLSQSGNLALEIAAQLASHQLGVSRFASLGNQADLTAADLVDACVADPNTTAIALYCEDFQDGRQLVRAAERASAAGKPVALLTVGGSQASTRTARSHTGALASASVVVDAACRAAGMERVTSPAQLAHLVQALIRTTPPRGNRVAILADGGGQASVACDAADAAGLHVPEFGATLQADLAARLPPSAAVSNPVDLAGGGEQDLGSFPSLLARLDAADEIDASLVTSYFGGYALYGDALAAAELDAANRIAQVARRPGSTLLVQTMHHDSPAADRLRGAGVAVYRGIDEAAWVLGRLAHRGTHSPVGLPTLPAPSSPVTTTGYTEARSLLQDSGIRFPVAVEVGSEHDLLAAARTMRHPLVLKALGEEHKSDRGGVVLGIGCEADLLAAYRDMVARLGPPAVSVEEQADLSEAIELLVGARRDPRFGPVVLVGLGGVLTEVFADVACALAPVTSAQARDLLLSLRGAALLTGVRGRPAVDLDAAADVVARLSGVAAAHPELTDLECNPVAATPAGALALDARMALERTTCTSD